MRAVRVHRYGGPDALVMDDVPDPEAGPAEVRIAVERAGVNFTDTYRRAGFYPSELPYVAGLEAFGVIDQVGRDVTDLREGDRVAFPYHPAAYAERVVVPAENAVVIPEFIPPAEACALMMQGLTAHYLATSTFLTAPGTTALVLAAAGGVGRLLVQVARLRGARVIAAVSTEEKAAIALHAGADEVLVQPGASLTQCVLDLTSGTGVDVAYDAVGLATYRQSMAAVRPRGTVVLYGQASGAVPPFDSLDLAERSVFLTRPRLHPHIATREELLRRSVDLFAWFGSGRITVRIDREYELEWASAAHAYLESGRSTGKVLLRTTDETGDEGDMFE